MAQNLETLITSLKTVQIENRDNIDLDAPNLKKGCDRFSSDSLIYKLVCGFIGWKVPYSSNKILPMKFYSSSLELFTFQIHTIFLSLIFALESLSQPFLDLDVLHPD